MIGSIKTPADQIEDALDAWVEHMFSLHDTVPDFWDECDASRQIGEWLAACGYRRSGPSTITLPSDSEAAEQKEKLG